MNDFAVFILTYGRAEKVYTFETLKKQGYTGKIYFLCSSDDKQLDNYKKLYKDKVCVFNKEDYINKFDIGDNFDDKRVVVYARNAVFDVAKKIGINYFLVLDDDYTDFGYRFDNELKYKYKGIKNLNYIFKSILKFYKKTNILSIALAQGGDYIGGKESGFAQKIQLKRKCMNTFFCSTERRFNFIGRINEDVNTYVALATTGGVFFTTSQISVQQLQTQSNSGGLTEFYLDGGTYVKSFYTIIFSPSSVKINLMGNKHKRLHHKVKWNNTVPKILSEIHKK